MTILEITSISNLFLNPSKDNFVSVSFPFPPINLEEMMFGCWSDRDNTCPELVNAGQVSFSTNSEIYVLYSVPGESEHSFRTRFYVWGHVSSWNTTCVQLLRLY